MREIKLKYLIHARFEILSDLTFFTDSCKYTGNYEISQGSFLIESILNRVLRTNQARSLFPIILLTSREMIDK